jgi:hypothetical protein
MTAVVNSRVAPSVNGKPSLDVERPQVAPPKLRVRGRARKATTTASPELATAPLVNTATLGAGSIRT